MQLGCNLQLATELACNISFALCFGAGMQHAFGRLPSIFSPVPLALPIRRSSLSPSLPPSLPSFLSPCAPLSPGLSLPGCPGVGHPRLCPSSLPLSYQRMPGLHKTLRPLSVHCSGTCQQASRGFGHGVAGTVSTWSWRCRGTDGVDGVAALYLNTRPHTHARNWRTYSVTHVHTHYVYTRAHTLFTHVHTHYVYTRAHTLCLHTCTRACT